MNTYLLYGLFVIVLVQFGWIVWLSMLYRNQQLFLKELTQDMSKKDLKTILKNIAQSIRSIGSEIERLDGEIISIVDANRTHFQKMGFVRFNPYGDTGGNQSFCLTLLDQNDNGIVMTSLHSREQTRIYAKPIANGKEDSIQFSKEESEAISRALGSNRKNKLKKDQA